MFLVLQASHQEFILPRHDLLKVSLLPLVVPWCTLAKNTPTWWQNASWEFPPTQLGALVDFSPCELGENKEVEVVPEASTPPLSKSHPIVVKKIKMQQPWLPPGEMQYPSSGHGALCPHPYRELVDLGSQFKQKPLESISAWLLCLWDVGMSGIISVLFRDGKASFSDNSSCLVSVTAEYTPDTTVIHFLSGWWPHFTLYGPIRVSYHILPLDGWCILISNRCYGS